MLKVIDFIIQPRSDISSTHVLSVKIPNLPVFQMLLDMEKSLLNKDTYQFSEFCWTITEHSSLSVFQMLLDLRVNPYWTWKLNSFPNVAGCGGYPYWTRKPISFPNVAGCGGNPYWTWKPITNFCGERVCLSLSNESAGQENDQGQSLLIARTTGRQLGWLECGKDVLVAAYHIVARVARVEDDVEDCLILQFTLLWDP